MNGWQDAYIVREHRERLLAEARRERLLRAAGVGDGPDLGAVVRGRVLGWVIAAHHRLHELESAQLSRERV
jgi:hypothetical protein